MSIKKCSHLVVIKNLLRSLRAKRALLAFEMALATCSCQFSLGSKMTPNTFIDFFEVIDTPCKVMLIWG